MIPHAPFHTGDYAVAVVIALFVGGLATVCVRFIGPAGHRTGRTPAVVGLVTGILVCTALLKARAMDHMFGGYFSFKTPRERMQDHYADFEASVMRNQDVQRAVGAGPASARLQEMNRRGMRRLDDAALLQSARLKAVLLSGLSDRASLCIVGASDPTQSDNAEIEATMLRLGSGFNAAWMEVSYDAIVAEARQSPVRHPTQDEKNAAARALVEQIGREAAVRLVHDLREGASQEEVLRSARALYSIAPTMEEPHGALLLRLLGEAFGERDSSGARPQH